MSTKNNKSIVVIGGNGLIGKIIVDFLLDQNFNVGVVDFGAKYINDHKNLIYYKADINNPNQIKKAAKSLKIAYGNLDCIIN